MVDLVGLNGRGQRSAGRVLFGSPPGQSVAIAAFIEWATKGQHATPIQLQDVLSCPNEITW